jgi:N-acetylglutamate synthase-like GNAT family acetyltransferase
MSDSIIIRKANESDLEEILALINAPEADNGTLMELRDANTIYQTILNDSNYFQIIASSEQGIVGIVTLVIIVQMTHEGSTTALISDLIVSEKLLSRELQATVTIDLLQYASNLAHEYGCYKSMIQNDYQSELTEGACEALGFEKSNHSFLTLSI